MNDEVASRAAQAANNTILLVVARVSMALALPVLAAISTIGGMYLDQKFEAQDVKIEQQKQASDNEARIQTARVERIEKMATLAIENAAKVGERLISVETKQNQESVSSAQFQQATLARLDRMQESIVSLSNSIASLTATLQAQENYTRRRQPLVPPD
jgi:hypothetical protein